LAEAKLKDKHERWSEPPLELENRRLSEHKIKHTLTSKRALSQYLQPKRRRQAI